MRDHLPPPRSLMLFDTPSQFARMWNAFGHLGERGPADGQRVMVIPGFLATDRGTLGLQRALGKAGFRVRGWGLGLNRGAHPHVLDDIVAHLEIFSAGEPVILAGWSLGGLFAREVAKARPDLARAVFTMGSPFSGDPRANNVWRLYERVAGHPVDRPPIAFGPAAKPPVPTYALWSRRDAMVAPACARGTTEESDEQIELRCGHMAFASNPSAVRQVVRVIRDRMMPNASAD